MSKFSPIILLQVLCICGIAYALQGSTAENGSNAAAVHQLGITGNGVNIGLISSGNVFTGHSAFFDEGGICHAENVDASPSLNTHDTTVAGIILSSIGRTSHPNDIGVAPGAFLYSMNTNSTLQTILNELVNRSCRVIVTGVHWPDTVADGNNSVALSYDYYAAEHNIIFANAAGNGAIRVTVAGDAYNGITTGGLETTETDVYTRVGDTTNFGPTVDARRKPDIMSPSTNQTVPGYSNSNPDYWYQASNTGATSWAAPHTAGVAALLLEYADSTTDTDDGHNEVIKAVIVNSTFPNIKDRTDQNTDPTVWHAQRGYGRIDALRAYQTLLADRITKDVPTTAMLGWAYDTMDENATHYYYIEGKKNERLVLTAAWNRKPTRSGRFYIYSDENPPKFNINLTIVRDSNSQVLFSETDPNNNLEKVDILLPADGNYTITLANATDKNDRGYGLAFERLPAMAGDFNVDYAVDGNDLYQIVSNWLEVNWDINIVADGIINWLDFAYFADNWLKIDPRYHIE